MFELITFYDSVTKYFIDSCETFCLEYIGWFSASLVKEENKFRGLRLISTRRIT